MFVTILLAACTSSTEPVDTADTGDTGEPADTAVDDADPMVDSYIPDHFTTDMPARVIFIGDSITAGNGASKNKLDYVHLLQENADETWPVFADADFAGAWGGVPEVIDESVPGATTASLAYGQLEDVAEAVGDTVSGHTAVVVTIAGNDVQALLFSPNDLPEALVDIDANLEVMYEFFGDTARFPDGASIYLANVYEPSDGVGQADECFFGLDLTSALATLDAVNAATRAQAEAKGGAWLDMHGHFLGHGYYAGDSENPYHQADDPSLWFDEDCIHPNDRGHHEIRRLFWHALSGQAWPGDMPVE